MQFIQNFRFGSQQPHTILEFRCLKAARLIRAPWAAHACPKLLTLADWLDPPATAGVLHGAGARLGIRHLSAQSVQAKAIS
jgi:hypothetical protein